MSTQTSFPFACRQCGFCKEAFRVDGGGGSGGYESAQFRQWFCSTGCLQLARLFNSEPGEFNKVAHDSLIKTYNNCFTKVKRNGEVIHIPRKNDKEVRNDIEAGRIFLIRSIHERTNDDNHFGKYD